MIAEHACLRMTLGEGHKFKILSSNFPSHDFCFRSNKQLSTVGSPFWMAPEVIKGFHYNEKVGDDKTQSFCYVKCSKILNTFLFLFSNKMFGFQSWNSRKCCQKSNKEEAPFV